MASAPDFAGGRVHVLNGGSAELRAVLESAASRCQLALVDFSASWCGPCRMMEPVLAALAAEHRGRLAVCKVDCEATPANQALAASEGIRGFPTFHLYRSQAKVAQITGANPAGLRSAITQQLALLGPAARPGGMAAALAAALGKVKAACTFAEFVAAAKVLLLFVGNVLEHPNEERYRRVRASNSAFQRQLGSKPGGRECMAAVGFLEMSEAGEQVFVMMDVPAELASVRSLLQQAVAQGEAAAAAAAARPGVPAPAAAPVAAQAASTSAAAAPVPAAPVTAAAPSVPAPAAAAPSLEAPGAGAPDAAALAAALAAAMALGGGAAAAPAAGGSGGQQAGQVSVAQGRTVRLTPRQLARVLEKCLLETGAFGVQPPPAPPAP